MLNLEKSYGLSAQGAANVRKGIFWTVVTNLVVMSSMSLLYLLMRDLTAVLLDGAPLPSAQFYLGLCALFFVLLLAVHLQQYTNTYGTVYDEVSTIRILLAERLRRLPLSFFGNHDLADLTETLMGDVDKLEHVWSHVLGYFFGACISTCIVAVGMLSFDWRLAVAALWAVPVAFLLLFVSQRWTAPLQQRAREEAVGVSDALQEMLDDVREVHATNQVERYLDSIRDKIDGSEATTVRSELVGGLFVNGCSVILRLGMATTILVGAALIAAGEADFLTLFMFLLAISRIYAPFDQAIALMYELMFSKVSSARLQRFFDEPLATGSEDFSPQGHDIEFDHVAFGYGEQAENVLRDVSFTAREGEVTALVGPSGSGKSTCGRLVARLWDADRGAVRVGGVDVSTVDPETLFGHCSIVFQDVMLFDDTVMENIRLGRRGATDEEVLAAARAAMCDEFVSRLPEGYDSLIGENGSRLSGGERQRISIARAMLKGAPIVLLDEATASLDVENETKVQRALSALLRGKTVLVIAHRMRTVSSADKVVVLEDGHVSEQGAPEELLAAGGSFARMVRLQRESEGWKL
ncbi:ABC transporter ATP-binding protein [Olsenella urininfantis]|uniref:ABC transporter ATP-binding protein n=1 Tax=Olsenella urininfantis TaxID=1871033 RepID=UPI0009879957|nr:ABC transporter ATP-binding protein [Olsenella urininfantis]